MRRNQLITLAAIPIAVLAVATPASAATAKSTTPVRHHWTFALATTGQQIVGTTYIETDTLTRAGQPAGLALLTCPGAAQGGVAVAHCDVALGLAGGTIEAVVTIDNATGAVRGHITTGTRRYEGAAGTVTGGPTTTGSNLTIKFTTSRY